MLMIEIGFGAWPYGMRLNANDDSLLEEEESDRRNFAKPQVLEAFLQDFEIFLRVRWRISNPEEFLITVRTRRSVTAAIIVSSGQGSGQLPLAIFSARVAV
jgi:hypothetical protein